MNHLIALGHQLSAPIGRLLLASIFLMSAMNKIFSYLDTVSYMEAMGVSGSLLPLVILTEAIGAIAIILGWHTRLAAFILAGFTLLATLLFHFDFSSQIQMIMFMKNIAIIGAFLLLIHHGPGTFSVDQFKERSQES